MYGQVSRRLQHRILLVYQHPSLLSLDGVLVNSSEKQAAQVVFGPEQQVYGEVSTKSRGEFIAYSSRTILQTWDSLACLVPHH